jgi:hypothetical protein
VLLEYFGRFPKGVRATLFFGLVATYFALLVRFILIPSLKLLKLGKVISHEEASLIIGRHFPEVSDRLLNTLQLKRAADSAAGHDTSLLMASIEQRIENLRPVPFASAVDFGENRRYLRYVLPPLALAAILLLVAPSVLKEGTQRIVSFNQEFLPEAPFGFYIENQALEVPLNEDFVLEVRCEGAYIPGSASVVVDGKSFRLKANGDGTFTHIFRKVRGDLPFRLSADGFYSPMYELKVQPTPALVQFEVALQYPEYTGKPAESLANTGNLRVPEGTTIAWKFATRHTESLHLFFADSTVRLSSTGRDLFTYQRRFKNSEPYSLTAYNAVVGSRDTLSYRIDVVKDAFPKIQVESLEDSTDARRVFFSGLASDDYGLTKLTFHYSVTGTNGEVAHFQESLAAPRSSSHDFYHFKDFSSLELKPGEQVNYYFEVWDNDRVNGNKSARSERRSYKAPTLEELTKERREANEETKDKMEEAIKQASQLQKELNELNRDLIEKKDMSWQEKKRVEDILKKQRQLERDVENIKNQRQNLQQKQAAYLQQSESILQKQQQLDRLFDQIMSDEMKELYKKLEDLLEKLDQNQLNKELQNLKMDNEQLEKELDRSLEILKQLEFEQEFEQTMEKLDKLAAEEEKLAKESNDGKTPAEELQQKQEELNKAFEELQKDLQELEKMNQALEQPVKLPDTKNMEEEIKREMKKSAEELQKNRQKKASESQKNAADGMKKMSKMMQDAMDAAEAESQQEDMDALRALLENIIRLSFEQEDIMETLRRIDREDPKYVMLGQRQKKLLDDSKMVQDSLFALSKRVAAIEPIVNQEIGTINRNIQQALEEIGERITANATMRQQYSMTSFNNLALLLDEALQQMQKSMANSQPGTGNCQKPGGAGSKPSSGKMSKLQEEMGKKLEQMQKGLEKGQKPGDRKPGSGSQQMSMEIAKMAAEQAAIRREIEKMAQELNKEGKGAGNQLKEIAEKMEETEKDLVNLRITPETMRRQQEIMTRLLESEKADREREQDNKRESQTPGQYNPSIPPTMLEYQRLKSREVELLRTMPPYLKPYYKERVNQYFLNFEHSVQ